MTEQWTQITDRKARGADCLLYAVCTVFLIHPYDDTEWCHYLSPIYYRITCEFVCLKMIKKMLGADWPIISGFYMSFTHMTTLSGALPLNVVLFTATHSPIYYQITSEIACPCWAQFKISQ